MQKQKFGMRAIVFTSLASFIFGGIGVHAAGEIYSANYKKTTVVVNGKELYLKNNFVGIIDEDDKDTMKLYMPLREVLENMNYTVEWCAESKTVYIDDKTVSSVDPSAYGVTEEYPYVEDAWVDDYGYLELNLDEETERDITWRYRLNKTFASSFEDTYSEGYNDTFIRHTYVLKLTPETLQDDTTFDNEQLFIFDGYNSKGELTGDILGYTVNILRPGYRKPNIYLYPQQETAVDVKIDLNGELTHTYPKYDNGWSVTAYPDGKLINHADGLEYSYLFWEGNSCADFDMSKGFVVKGEDTIAFLQEKLAYMGLTPKEYNEFIVYWLPYMENNAYNLITFQNEAYTDNAVLHISPEPDSVLRVFMVFEALDQEIEVDEPELTPFERKGFTVVEWGGSEVATKSWK